MSLLSFCVCYYGQLQQDPWSSWKETPPPRTETQTKPCYCEMEAISSSVSRGSFLFQKSNLIMLNMLISKFWAQGLLCPILPSPWTAGHSAAPSDVNCLAVSSPWTAFGFLGEELSTYLRSPLFTLKRDTESWQAAQRARQILSSGYCRKTAWQAGILTGAVSNSSMKCSPESDSSHPSPSEQYKLVVHRGRLGMFTVHLPFLP